VTQSEHAATDAWLNMPTRLKGEREQRIKLGATTLHYFNAFLDDLLRGIFAHDLVLLGAPSGMGKTDMALSIAISNAMKERRCAYFALEAEPRELERRQKFAWITAEAYRRNIPRKGELNYADWYSGQCEEIVGDLDAEADRWFENNLALLWTYYRGQRFDKGDLRKQIEKIAPLSDLIVIDHLHYVDADQDQDNENTAIGETTKAIRDISLIIGKPILLVAHLRKRDQRARTLAPSIDDFHGSSNIVKIATQVITIGPATVIEAPKWYLAPTFISVLKDRRAGAPPFVALTMFDRRTRRYEDTYSLGRMTKGGTEWEEIKPSDRPGWATGFKQMELDV
jgi:hypothetical protein